MSKAQIRRRVANKLYQVLYLDLVLLADPSYQESLGQVRTVLTNTELFIIKKQANKLALSQAGVR